MRSIRKTAGKKAAPKRQTKRAAKKAAPKRVTKRTAKRAAPKSARKTAAKRKTASRGHKVSFARRWERRIEGWRRFFIRHSYMKGYAVLAALTVGIYTIWASGIVTATSTYVGEQARNASMAAGFTVQRVTFEGHEETNPIDVLDALGIEIGTPIFDLDLRALQAQVEALDWVEHATVMRVLPGQVHIIIQERVPFALWQREGTLRVVSNDGGVITSAAVEQYSHLPHVVGIGAAAEAADLFRAINHVPSLSPRVRHAVRVSDRRWDLHFDSGVVVQLPELNMTAALEALATYENEHRLLARAIATVDLRLEDRIVVRPRSSNPEQSPALALPSAFERET